MSFVVGENPHLEESSWMATVRTQKQLIKWILLHHTTISMSTHKSTYCNNMVNDHNAMCILKLAQIYERDQTSL